MYCIGCGAENIEGSAHCIRCGHALITLRTDTYTKPTVDSSSVALWNPDVAALLSIPFSPILGSIIIALNWRRLGQPRRARAACIWTAFIILAVLVVLIFGANERLSESAIDGYLRLTQFITLILWYFGSARAQGKYIVKEIRNEYRRESWFTPLCLGVILIASLYGLAGQLS
jgi:hypothetical protein